VRSKCLPGLPFCRRHASVSAAYRVCRCSRYLLPHLSAQNASSLLDAGLSFYENKLDPYLKHTKSPGCPQVRSRLGVRG
jgi:uncharacterized protein YchJ